MVYHVHLGRACFRYLKRVVLPRLVTQGEVEQIHLKVTLSAEELQQRLQSMTKAQRKSATQRAETTTLGNREDAGRNVGYAILGDVSQKISYCGARARPHEIERETLEPLKGVQGTACFDESFD